MSHKLPNKQIDSKLLEENELTDVRFVFESTADQTREVAANKQILASASTVFRAMFLGEKDKQTFDVTDATADAFKEFLQFFYSSEVTLTMENIEQVARLADKYDMMKCVNTCATFLIDQLTTQYMVWGLQLAIVLNNEQLKQYCEKNIRKSATEVFKTDAFRRCNSKVLEHILRMDNMLCDEIDVFDACLAWARNACKQNGTDSGCENLRSQLGGCFALLRFGEIILRDLSHYLLENGLKDLFTRDEYAYILFTTYGRNYKCDFINRIPRSVFSKQWKDDQMLACNRVRSNFSSSNHNIRKFESIHFSTNVPLLFGRIGFGTISSCSYGSLCLVSGKLSIIEWGPEVSGKKQSETLYIINATLDGTLTTHAFHKTIVIKPQTTYEVRLEKRGNGGQKCEKKKIKAKVVVDGDIVIEFHDFANNDVNGLFQTLYFNRL